ncbi:MAG TPA: hypothetical protein VFO65_03030, partial [Acidimicrobiales bacterium]|nr:hypothetical protein [Acidimicrobiales bacterium]
IVRGMAGSGYVLIDEAELADPRRCGAFRRSAGVAGTCGRWVVAHEVAHQWFRWSAFARAGPAYGALWEGTADYLAYSWWRAVAGDDDAADLAGQLFGGRLDLAPGFAATHAPVAVPSGMTDGEGRALVYGRSSVAWLAVERAAGRATTEEVLAAVFTAGLRSTATGRALAAEALEAAAAVDAGAAEVLRRWWTATPLRPAAAEWSPATAG